MTIGSRVSEPRRDRVVWIGMKHLSALIALLLCTGCGDPPRAGSDPAAPADPAPTDRSSVPCTSKAEGCAPTYTEVFDQYFAKGTPGHCATAGCHANPGFNNWLCGETKDSCYAGMVEVGLINPQNPPASLIGNPTQSPLSWVNPTGNMPFDATGPLPTGRAAILAWVGACAPND